MIRLYYSPEVARIVEINSNSIMVSDIATHANIRREYKPENKRIVKHNSKLQPSERN